MKETYITKAQKTKLVTDIENQQQKVKEDKITNIIIKGCYHLEKTLHIGKSLLPYIAVIGIVGGTFKLTNPGFHYDTSSVMQQTNKIEDENVDFEQKQRAKKVQLGFIELGVLAIGIRGVSVIRKKKYGHAQPLNHELYKLRKRYKPLYRDIDMEGKLLYEQRKKLAKSKILNY